MAEPSVERPRSPFRLILISVLLALVVLAGISMLSTQGAVRKRFRFIKVDHPVDMWNDGRDRWIYYFTGESDTAKLAAEARKELLPLGFKEDTSMKPWYRFLKGSEEVVVCFHDQVELNGSKLMPQRKHPGAPKVTNRYAVVHAKNGPGSKSSLVSFQALKLLYGW